MIESTLAMQQAIVAALRGDETVSALIDGRIYDAAPAKVAKPYITIGPCDLVGADADCIDGDVISQQIDIWSIEPGQAQCRTICGAVRKVLRRLQCDQGGLRFEIEHQSTRVLDDADGITTHGVVTVQAIIDILGD